MPWQLMVRPVSVWTELQTRGSLITALAWQWLLLCLAELVASPVVLEAAGNPAEGSARWLRPLGVLLAFIPLTLLMNALLATLCWLLFRLLGLNRSYASFLHWSAYGMLPFVLGTFLGRLSLELLHPQQIPKVLAAPLQFRGISIGLASWLPAGQQALGFGWVSLSYLDVFGIWSLILLGLGLRHYLRAERSQSMLGSLALLLLSLLLITGIWRIFHQLAVAA